MIYIYKEINKKIYFIGIVVLYVRWQNDAYSYLMKNTKLNI